MSDKFNVSTCIYCGDIGKDRHHYKESVANSGRKRSYKKDEVLPTCRECNSLLGTANPEYTECCYILYDKVSQRHKDIISMPEWDEDELNELAGHLKRQIKSSLSKKKIHLERLNELLSNAQSTMTNNEIKEILEYGW